MSARLSIGLLALSVGLASLAGCDMLISGKGSPDERARQDAPKAATADAPVKAADAGAPAPAADGAPAGAATTDAAPGAEKPAVKEVPKDPLDAAIAAQEGYVYNPIGKRDPFRSFMAAGARDDDDTPHTPLQRYDLDQYALVGVIWGIDRPRALVQDPEKTGHVIEIGTYIGKNWGKVTQISNSGVVVTEEYQTIDGELVVNEIPMKLVSNDTDGRRK